MITHDVPNQAKEKGAFLLEKLNALREKYPTVIKEIRGVGLLIAVEFPQAEIGYSLAKGMFSRRVMTAGTLNNATTIRIEPPLTISYEDLESVLARMEEALADTKKEFNL
jgi:putrescine aminotransferase